MENSFAAGNCTDSERFPADSSFNQELPDVWEQTAITGYSVEHNRVPSSSSLSVLLSSSLKHSNHDPVSHHDTGSPQVSAMIWDPSGAERTEAWSSGCSCRKWLVLAHSVFVRVFQSRKSDGLVSRRDRDWNGVGLVVMIWVIWWMVIWLVDMRMAWLADTKMAWVVDTRMAWLNDSMMA